MSTAGKIPRGGPLAMLTLIIFSWVAVRAVLWESPFTIVAPMIPDRILPQVIQEPARLARSNLTSQSPIGAQSPAKEIPKPVLREVPASPALPIVRENSRGYSLFMENPNTAGGHQLLWMAAMAHLPIPSALHDRIVTASSPDRLQSVSGSRQDRWSLDSWFFLREGPVLASTTQGRVPSYGASQAAAVLRYRFAPQNSYDPHVYARAYQALIERGESELALGVSARPVKQIPVRTYAEIRVTDRINDIDFRPAGFVTSELPPIPLPATFRAEAYVQAGYVGGKGATAFADGQLHILHDVKEFDLGRVSLGGAAWGGAQEGARRVDIGPSLRLDIKLDDTPARLSLDYRERVAGNARPHSGIAVTISSSF